MRVLVTGGAGFIGSHLCEALLETDHEVVAFDNFDPFYDPHTKRRNIAGCQKKNRFTLIEGDIRDGLRVEETLAAGRFDAIIHLAALAGVRPSIERPRDYQDVNVGGTTVMLEAARRHGIRRFVFASSSSVYGDNARYPFAESDRVDEPISPYAATKRAGELLCHTYAHLHDIDITCLRFFTAYGPRQRPDLAIHRFARLMLHGQPIPVFGNGDTLRDYTYIDDIVDGLRRALPRCDGFRVYNLGRGTPVSLSAMIEALGRALDMNPIIDRLPLQPGDTRRTGADITRARQELGYEPRTPLHVGLKHFARWLREASSVTSVSEYSL